MSFKCHLILRKPRDVCSGGLPVRHGHVTRGREMHAHFYTWPPASLGNELGGLSTALGLFASPSLTLSTKGVVVMGWKGRSTSIATRTAPPDRCYNSRGSLSCSSSPRGRWKMTVTGGLESLAARCQRATVHGLTVQSADVAMVQACSGRRRCSRWRVAVPILVLIEV